MNRLPISLIAACSLVAACSSDSGFNVPTDPPAAMAITAANAVQVTRVSYQAALETGGFGDLSSITGPVAIGATRASKIDASFATSNGTGRGTAQDPIPAIPQPCIPSGSMTISGDLANPLTLTPGDFFDVVFDMCDDGFSVANGDLHYVVAAFSGELFLGIYDLTMNATFSNFQVATLDDTLTSNGDATVRLNISPALVVTVEVGGLSLVIDKDSSSDTQTDYSSSQIQDAGVSPSPYTLDSSGTLSSTQLSGVVQYSTPIPFAGFDADYPDSGEFLVTAGDNSSARLTAIDNVSVRIEIDTDGDGFVDEVIDTTWVELESAP